MAKKESKPTGRVWTCFTLTSGGRATFPADAMVGLIDQGNCRLITVAVTGTVREYFVRDSFDTIVQHMQERKP